jgi:PAS domain S-box-containing protein
MREKKLGKKTPARRAVQKKRVVRKPKYLSMKKKRARVTGTGTPGLNGEGLYASLFEDNHAVMLLIDPKDGKIVDANAAACSFYGYTKAEILKKKITNINTLTRKQVFKEMGLAKSGKRSNFLCRHRLSSGETRDVEVYNGPVTVRGRSLLYSIVHDITARKRTEEALLESEEKFRALADHVPVGIIIHRAGILQYIGREAARLMGYENPDEEVGRSILEFIPEEDRSWIADITRRRIAGESVPAQYEARLAKRDGSIIEALIFAMLIDYGGEQATLTAFVDITERKRADEALLQSERRLQSLFRAAPIGIGLVHNRIIGWTNEDLHQMTGYPAEELTGRSARVLYPDDSEFERVGLEKYAEIRRRGMGTIETRWQRKDGKIIDVYLSSALVNPGDESAGVVFTAMDITARKQAEEYLRRAQAELEKRVEERTNELLLKNLQLEREINEREKMEEALRQMTEQLSMLLESLPIIPYSCESSGGVKITYVGGTIKNFTGYPPESFTEDPSFYLAHLHPDDRKQLLENLDSDRQKGRGRYEYRFRIADGTYRWFADTWHCIESDGDASDYIAGVWQDITEEKRLRQEAEVRLQQVIQGSKMAALGEVVAGVVHEINNPNSFIAYNVPLLEKIWTLCEPVLAEYASTHPGWVGQGVRFNEIRQDVTEIIEAFRIGSDRINKVILNLKDFSRADEEIEMRSVRVNDVIQKALMIVGGQIRRTVSRMDLMLCDDLPVIQGHFQKLEQVFANLLINACQAVKPGTQGTITVTTRYLDRLKCIAVAIEDNGLGIEPQAVNRLFEPFFTTRRDAGGTGLGLSVSYGLVREQGGVIGVLSRPGVGSRFTVFLPLSRDAQLVLHPSILCLNDDIDLLEDLRANLSDVEVPFCGLRPASQEIIDYIDDHPEVDIVLYERTAFDDVAGEIKGRFPLLTLIGCGGEAGGPADYFLAKPFEIKVFLEIIDQAGRQRL